MLLRPRHAEWIIVNEVSRQGHQRTVIHSQPRCILGSEGNSEAMEPGDCSRTFRELEVRRAELMSEFAGWPPSRLRFRPAPGTWSVVEVLDHIVKAESGTVADVRAGLQNPQALGDVERPGIAALDRALRSDQKFTVPASAASIHPDAQTTFADVASRWEHARAQFRSLLGTLSPKDTHCGVFHHPSAGWMTVADGLDYFAAHLYHHGFQLARLRESSAALVTENPSGAVNASAPRSLQ